MSGKIQTLKKIRESLDEKGIQRFNSIGDINLFLENYNNEKDNIPKIETNKLDVELESLKESIRLAREKSTKNVLFKIFYGIKIRWVSHKEKSLINDYENILSKRCRKSTQKLDNIKNTVDNLYPLISGAIGENAVVNELKKLPDSYYVINDFSLNFHPPIYLVPKLCLGTLVGSSCFL